jgi:hypothetical protein
MRWRRSSRCAANGTCLEVAAVGRWVAARDGALEGGAVLLFSPGAWRVFTGQVKAGHLDERR